MNSKIVYSSLLVILCVIPLGYGIKCYRCLSGADCQTPAYVTCTAEYATETASMLNYFFQNVTVLLSNNFDCMRMKLTFGGTSTMYKGCSYSTMNSCGYTLRPNITTGGYYNKQCYQCNNFNGCNPASRSYVSVAALLVPLLFVLKLIVL